MQGQVNTKQAEPQIIIKGSEVVEFEQMLNDFPHGVAKKIINFVNKVQMKRQAEYNEEQSSKAIQAELDELRAFKKTTEESRQACKEAPKSLPKLNSDEGDE